MVSRNDAHQLSVRALLVGLLLGLVPFILQPPLPASAADPVLAGAGDVACDPSLSSFNGGLGSSTTCRQKYTSDLLLTMNPDAVFMLGDGQNEQGTLDQYMKAYDPSWGRVKAKTHPASGNHDYLTSGANGYYTYFGAAAGDPSKGYYSYEMGSWHVVVLNSQCSQAGGCGTGSPQETWLRSDLAAHPNACTLAYWHIPLWSSGGRAAANAQVLMQDLYDANAEVVLNGHDHVYERFAPQSPQGQLDNARGIREFVVGTGGANHTSFTTTAANSQFRNDTTFGVLKLTLHPTAYDWQFVAESGNVLDSGTTACHGAGGVVATPTTTNADGTELLTFNAVADAYVSAANSSANYGTATQLRVDASPVVRSYLRFNVTGVSGAITKATLQLYGQSSQSTGYGVYRVANTAWGETSVTYGNAPALGSIIGSSGAVTDGAWSSVDVTSYITGNGAWSLALTTSSATALSVASREAAREPQLLIETSSAGSTTTPTRTQTPTGGVSTATPTTASSPTPTAVSGFQPAPPIQAAFFYPWFPDAWTQGGVYPFTNYHPSLGYYGSTDDNIIDQQLNLAKQAHLEAMISSWWGKGHHTDTAFAHILSRSERSGSPYQNMRWTIYYENESLGDPSVSTLVSDLQYLANSYFGHAGYLRVNGKPVVFVYADANDSCSMADRWVQAKNQVGGNVYLVLKVFAGYANCASQPDAWHQYSPAVGYDVQGAYSAVASPGFWLKNAAVRLARDPVRFEADVKRVASSGAFWQLITTWNEWGEGTSVEPATEWGNDYIDILCRNLPGSTACSGLTTPVPTSTAGAATATRTATPTATSTISSSTPTKTSTPTATSTSPANTPARTPTRTATSASTPGTFTFTPVADTFVSSANTSTNYGTATQIRIDGSPVVNSYLRFNVTGLTGSVATATLRLYANSSASTGGQVRGVANNTWGETTITFGNAPAPSGTVSGATGPFNTGSWASVSITPLITGNGTYSIAVTTTGSTAVSLGSRESGSHAPQLIVTTK